MYAWRPQEWAKKTRSKTRDAENCLEMGGTQSAARQKSQGTKKKEGGKAKVSGERLSDRLTPQPPASGKRGKRGRRSTYLIARIGWKDRKIKKPSSLEHQSNQRSDRPRNIACKNSAQLRDRKRKIKKSYTGGIPSKNLRWQNCDRQRGRGQEGRA